MTYRVDIDFELQWSDERLVANGASNVSNWDFKDDIDLEKVWTPNLEVINIHEGDPLGMEPNWRVKVVNGKPVISFERTFQVTCSAPMTLRKFPYDEQTLLFTIRSQDLNSSIFSMTLAKKDWATDCSDMVDWGLCKLEEYEIISSKITMGTHRYEYYAGEVDKKFSEFEMRIHLARKPYFYWWRCILSFQLFQLLGLSSMFLSFEDLGNRISITLTVFLTAVAFQLVLTSFLPKTPYNSILDWQHITCTMQLSAIFIANIAIVRTLEHDFIDDDKALLISKWTIGVLLLLQAASLVFFNSIMPRFM